MQMYKIGIFPGRFAPPHRGHINAILHCACRCERMYVVVTRHDVQESVYLNRIIKRGMTMKQKARWLSIELSDFEHIRVVMVEDGGIPKTEHEWESWSAAVRKAVGEPIDAIFGGELALEEGYKKWFPGANFEPFDCERMMYPVSGTQICADPLRYWDYILGAARPYFTKRILIAGGESTGKTTLTKALAKIFHTSWAREEGRYYPVKYMGGNENVYELEDFYNICWEQRQIEDDALRHANRIVFFDTDAVVTQYYCELYMGQRLDKIDGLIDESRYDKIILLTPDTPWVADGFRRNSDTEHRWRLHEHLKRMYQDYGFGDKIIEVGGDYTERLKRSIEISSEILRSQDQLH